MCETINCLRFVYKCIGDAMHCVSTPDFNVVGAIFVDNERSMPIFIYLWYLVAQTECVCGIPKRKQFVFFKRETNGFII